MSVFTFTPVPILKPTTAIGKADLTAAKIIEVATRITVAAKLIATDDLMLTFLQMGFIMLNLQRDHPINFIADAKSNILKNA